MISLQVSKDIPAWEDLHKKYDGRGTYGFGWWINGSKPSGERNWKNLPELAFAARGARRSFLYVEPESKLVVARINQDKKSAKHHPDDQYINALLFSLKRAVAQCEK